MKKNKLNTPNISRYFLYLVNGSLLIIILFALLASFRINLFDRSLWLDEAMLAFSFSKRDLSNLISSVFEWDQSAPVLYLYIVKLITILFGNTEFTLRIWSFITFLLTLLSSFYILKNILNAKIPLLGVAFISGISTMIFYSSEFKPYMNDCFTVLALVIIFYAYSINRINRATLNTIYFIIVWLSNPACFFIASLITIEAIEGIIDRDYNKIKRAALSAFVSLTSFIIYFFYWLKPVIDMGVMSVFWEKNKFPLVPTSLSDINTQIKLTNDLIYPIGRLKYIVLIVSLIGSITNLLKYKNRYINTISLAILFMLGASSIGLFPMQDRLFLFIYPLLGILFFFFLDKLSTNIYTCSFLLFCSFVVILSSNQIRHYYKERNIYRNNEEFNFAYSSLIDNLEEKDEVYVFYSTIPVFCYKNNFDTLCIANTNNNIVLGKGFFDNDQNIADINMLKEQESVFILATHSTNTDPKRILPLIDSLELNGTLSIVSNHYGTPLYHYSKNP